MRSWWWLCLPPCLSLIAVCQPGSGEHTWPPGRHLPGRPAEISTRWPKNMSAQNTMDIGRSRCAPGKRVLVWKIHFWSSCWQIPSPGQCNAWQFMSFSVFIEFSSLKLPFTRLACDRRQDKKIIEFKIMLYVNWHIGDMALMFLLFLWFTR